MTAEHTIQICVFLLQSNWHYTLYTSTVACFQDLLLLSYAWLAYSGYTDCHEAAAGLLTIQLSSPATFLEGCGRAFVPELLLRGKTGDCNASR